MKLVSSCLVGLRTTYRGRSNLKRKLLELVQQGEAIPVCPEQLGGLPTPRLPAEIEGGQGLLVISGRARVLRCDGVDVTEQFIRGAREVLRLAMLIKPECIIFKENSPSCGVNFAYDGSFTNRKVRGEGVTTAILRRAGFRVLSEADFLRSFSRGGRK
ncbi:MAG: DUF523 domain-containing protein [Candidatus Sumerlaeia bacterium]|nr:DUF523 domain-containing protein [Candidatus Sumerlaeia bacterium]